MKVKALIFDSDGVLLDTFSAAYSADSQVIPMFGGRVPSQEVWKRTLGENMINGGTWENFYRFFGVTDPESAEREFYPIYHSFNHLIIPGATDALNAVRQLGIPISLISHDRSLDDVVSKLTKPGLMTYFCPESVYCAKSSKTPSILAECERLEISPKDAFVVGDTVKDVKEGKAADAGVIAVLSRYGFNRVQEIQRSGPDYMVNSIRALPSLITRLR